MILCECMMLYTSAEIIRGLMKGVDASGSNLLLMMMMTTEDDVYDAVMRK
jgi:hypothetical protein